MDDWEGLALAVVDGSVRAFPLVVVWTCGRLGVQPRPPALLSRPQLQAVARPSVSIGLASRALYCSPLSRRVASSEPARASCLRRDLHSLETALGGSAEALCLMSDGLAGLSSLRGHRHSHLQCCL
jgi:hypothetical protein